MKERENAVADLLIKERKRLVGFIRHKINDISEMDAEDILQDLLVTIFEKTDLTAHVENLTAYIYRSLYHKAIDWLRRRKPAVSLEGTEFSEIDRDQWLDEGKAFDLTTVVEQKEFRECLTAALDVLEPRQRAVWIATEIEGYTFRELSQLWNEPIGTLLSRKSRANKALQNMLKDFHTEIR